MKENKKIFTGTIFTLGILLGTISNSYAFDISPNPIPVREITIRDPNTGVPIRTEITNEVAYSYESTQIQIDGIGEISSIITTVIDAIGDRIDGVFDRIFDLRNLFGSNISPSGDEAILTPLTSLEPIPGTFGEIIFDFSFDPIDVDETEIFLSSEFRGPLGTETVITPLDVTPVPEPMSVFGFIGFGIWGIYYLRKKLVTN